MRMLLPGKKLRKKVDAALTRYFREYQDVDFTSALAELAAWYEVKPPKIEWYEYLGHGKKLGETYETGQIELIHPEHAKRMTTHNTEREWVRTVLHEWAHYLLWADAEAKAEKYVRRFVEGLR